MAGRTVQRVQVLGGQQPDLVRVQAAGTYLVRVQAAGGYQALRRLTRE